MSARVESSEPPSWLVRAAAIFIILAAAGHVVGALSPSDLGAAHPRPAPLPALLQPPTPAR